MVLDATRPGIFGKETRALLKSMRPDVPVVMSSGFGETEMLRKFEGKGLAGFIQKPIRAQPFSRRSKT